MNDIRRGPFTSALVITNPHAGQVNADLVAELVALCQGTIPELSVHWTTQRGDAVWMAADAVRHRFDVVIAVGGDGTVREVVQGLISMNDPMHTPALLIVPAGTGNSNYLAQWGSLCWSSAVSAGLSGEGSSLCLFDLARLADSGDLVLLGACSGVIAEALIAARDVRMTGRERYRIALARAASGFSPYPGRVIVDGAVVHSGGTVLANVGGGRYRGGLYQLLPHSVLDDGQLDVCVVTDAIDPMDVPRLTSDGSHVNHPGVVYARGHSITVERIDGKPLLFEHDGELEEGAATSFTLEVIPRVLPVLCRTEMPGLIDS